MRKMNFISNLDQYEKEEWDQYEGEALEQWEREALEQYEKEKFDQCEQWEKEEWEKWLRQKENRDEEIRGQNMGERMSKDKFTPGPWSAPDKGKLRGAVVAKDGKMVCDPSGAGRHEDEAEANASLIAASPDMYELLGSLEDYFENRKIYGYGVEESVSADLLTKIKEVMKKARGEK